MLYDLHRTPNLTLILIANREEDVFSFLDERLHSRLQSCVRIKFGQYNLSELVAILRDRAQWGLEPGVIGDDGLETIANHAAGDARVAIGILRNATQFAVQNDHDEITSDVIRNAVPEARADVRQQTTERLTDHQQIIYEIINLRRYQSSRKTLRLSSVWSRFVINAFGEMTTWKRHLVGPC